ITKVMDSRPLFYFSVCTHLSLSLSIPFFCLLLYITTPLPSVRWRTLPLFFPSFTLFLSLFHSLSLSFHLSLSFILFHSLSFSFSLSLFRLLFHSLSLSLHTSLTLFYPLYPSLSLSLSLSPPLLLRLSF